MSMPVVVVVVVVAVKTVTRGWLLESALHVAGSAGFQFTNAWFELSSCHHPNGLKPNLKLRSLGRRLPFRVTVMSNVGIVDFYLGTTYPFIRYRAHTLWTHVERAIATGQLAGWSANVRCISSFCEVKLGRIRANFQIDVIVGITSQIAKSPCLNRDPDTESTLYFKLNFKFHFRPSLGAFKFHTIGEWLYLLTLTGQFGNFERDGNGYKTRALRSYNAKRKDL
ncbi:hypothetical protein SCHPADRAFT_896355 [Schizopora paradoxa]|uniref:Secreted protein n=1 Tax=Schizopora paradoxa TaxID=27342 RepID=A0A0H2R1X1_9AGAM|nr:hypothetical protein SCHPADRAFT_896355 [Schizopora paradoxa]